MRMSDRPNIYTSDERRECCGTCLYFSPSLEVESSPYFHAPIVDGECTRDPLYPHSAHHSRYCNLYEEKK